MYEGSQQNALIDLYIFRIATNFVETVDTAAV